MSEEENYTTPNLFAAFIGAIVENKSLDDALKSVGLSEAYVLKQSVAQQSSEAAIGYVQELLLEQFGIISKENGSSLYLVKKVLCFPKEYEAMAEAVSGEHTSKFQVLRLIGANPLMFKYKQKNHGIEAYLVSGRDAMEAMRKTTAADPTFNYNNTYFDVESAGEFDKLVTCAVYEHTPEAITAFFNAMKMRL